MKTSNFISTIGSVFVLFSALHAQAQFQTFDNKAAFLATTEFTGGPLNLPGSGEIAPNQQMAIGDVTWSTRTFPVSFGDASPLLPGNDVTLTFATFLSLSWASPVNLFGFSFVEPLPVDVLDISFRLVFFRQTVPVGTVTFNPANEAAYFFGVTGSQSFDSVNLAQDAPGLGNRYIGEIYSGVTAVPEPGTFVVFAFAGLVFGIAVRCKRRKAVDY